MIQICYTRSTVSIRHILVINWKSSPLRKLKVNKKSHPYSYSRLTDDTRITYKIMDCLTMMWENVFLEAINEKKMQIYRDLYII